MTPFEKEKKKLKQNISNFIKKLIKIVFKVKNIHFILQKN